MTVRNADGDRRYPATVIRTLAVEGYRSLRRLVLPLDRLNLITGANGAGKSSLYRSLRLLADSARGGVVSALAREGGLASTLWAGPQEGTRSGRPTQGTVRQQTGRAQVGVRGRRVRLRAGSRTSPAAVGLPVRPGDPPRMPLGRPGAATVRAVPGAHRGCDQAAGAGRQLAHSGLGHPRARQRALRTGRSPSGSRGHAGSRAGAFVALLRPRPHGRRRAGPRRADPHPHPGAGRGRLGSGLGVDHDRRDR